MGADVFPSKVDGWLAAVIAVAALMALVATAAVLMTDSPGRLPLAAVLFALGALLPLWVLFGTRYRVSTGELRIVSGPFRWTVPLADIHSVKRTRNPLSSPALSRA